MEVNFLDFSLEVLKIFIVFLFVKNFLNYCYMKKGVIKISDV